MTVKRILVVGGVKSGFTYLAEVMIKWGARGGAVG